MEIKKNKTATIAELATIIENSVKVKFNMVLDIDNIINIGMRTDKPDWAYPAQFCMCHGNMDGSPATRAYGGTNTVSQSLLKYNSEENYEKLLIMNLIFFCNN